MAKALGKKYAVPLFADFGQEEMKKMMVSGGFPADGKMKLFDGRTGTPYAGRVTIGYMYVLKLIHMVEDKIHARSVGPYSLITQQPLGGKARQ